MGGSIGFSIREESGKEHRMSGKYQLRSTNQ